MKTNITTVNLEGVQTFGKFIGDFDYEPWHYNEIGEEICFADIFQLLDGTYVTRLEDGQIHKTSENELHFCYRPAVSKGGKKHKKLARWERTHKPFRITEDDLPF